MKYWIADIFERNGEFEYTTPIRFIAETQEDANKIHLYHVGTWYGEDHMEWNDNDGCYWNDYIAVSEGRITEIDEHTFNTLRNHGSLPDMTPKKSEDFEDWLKRDAKIKEKENN